MEINKIYNEDCKIGMQRIPDHSVDAVICDLPYGVTDYDWDKIIDGKWLASEYKRVCKQNANVLLFCTANFAKYLLDSFLTSEFSHQLIWVKKNKTRHLSQKALPMSQHEIILCFRINKYSNKDKHKALRGYMMSELKCSGMSIKEVEKAIPNYSAHHWFSASSDYRIPTEKNYLRLHEVTSRFKKPYAQIKSEFLSEKDNICTYNGTSSSDVLDFHLTEKRSHPTQKPVALIEHLINAYTNQGDTILDNCIGSGTTAIAALNTGRNFIGFETDKTYYKIACDRIREALREPKLDI
jgi:site-specific DNA-methyltransferase (adenine-specific)